MQHVVDCGRQSCACRLVSFLSLWLVYLLLPGVRLVFFKVGFIANEGVLSVPDVLL